MIRDDKPRPKPSARPLALPELPAMKELRRALSFGGLTPSHLRTPEDHARIAAFRAMEELLHLLHEYRTRVERGERCRLVEREHVREKGRLLLELEIEVQP